MIPQHEYDLADIRKVERLAQRTADMLRGAEIAIWDGIMTNLNSPKPHHMNRSPMTKKLILEAS